MAVVAGCALESAVMLTLYCFIAANNWKITGLQERSPQSARRSHPSPSDAVHTRAVSCRGWKAGRGEARWRVVIPHVHAASDRRAASPPLLNGGSDVRGADCPTEGSYFWNDSKLDSLVLCDSLPISARSRALLTHPV